MKTDNKRLQCSSRLRCRFYILICRNVIKQSWPHCCWLGNYANIKMKCLLYSYKDGKLSRSSSRPSVIGRTWSPHTQQIGILFSFRNSFIVNLLTMGNTQTGHSDRCAPVNYTSCGVTVSPDWMIKFMF